MSENFFSYKQNFSKGLRNVLRDMLKNLECLCDDKEYREIHEHASRLYNNPYLMELSKLYNRVNCFYDNKKGCNDVVDFANNICDLNALPTLFINIFRDYDKLSTASSVLYNNCDETLCNVAQYVDVLDVIAFPCPCNKEDEKDMSLLDVCIPAHIYPAAFTLWFIDILGRIMNGCNDGKSAYDSGINFLIEMDVLVNFYEQFVRVGLALKYIPNRLQHKN